MHFHVDRAKVEITLWISTKHLLGRYLLSHPILTGLSLEMPKIPGLC